MSVVVGGSTPPAPTLTTIVREWGRIGCLGLGGPPAHIAMLRETCVERHGWIAHDDFEHAVAACNLLPGPASTQLAIFCGWRVRGVVGGLLAGASFILPGLVLIVALAGLFLGDPPRWVRGVGAGAGAVVAAVAVQAGIALMGPSWRHAATPSQRVRWIAYLVAGAAATALLGVWVVLVLLACGLIEVVWRRATPPARLSNHAWLPLVVVVAATTGGLAALCWTAFKVGALSYGGGFVIVPLMQADAVDHYGWMTAPEFLNAVALGQATPGPVVRTVSVVGFAAAGVGGALLAATVAFTPSFLFVLAGARHFDRLRTNLGPRAFLEGAGPAAIGAIVGSAAPLTQALTETWQYGILAAGAVSLLVLRRGVVVTILGAAAIGAIVAAAGGPVP